ncbi:NAD(P)H:quinone oxidoreductase [uncultured Alphaproteobacteria bacterium]|uniref:NAD(P)H:quinone oxidoreductase n=1 Tax=uncultured Alphaproteobacteria bacterium TaxID=91750 RepID=A0A212KGP9_9PROT|nr:NAD(P)H:quinone oxidoreductase [uncultured Alphaproteobacteria bacterium]
MIVVTGATGQLGRLVVSELLKTVPAAEVVALARDPHKAADLGVAARQGDYADPASLEAAFAGADKLLLISSSEVGQRVAQHRNAIAAAKRAGVKLIAYTSILHADSTPLGLGAEHRATEALLRDSGVPHVLLRNGWYTENYLASAPAAVAHGALLGAARDGRISSAARADYAAAAAAVLTGEGHAGRVYELAGDGSYTLADFAAELARASGKPVAYRDLPEAEFRAALEAAGLPAPIAALLADSDAGAAKGGLFDDGGALGRLIGRPTAPMAKMVAAAFA